MAGPDLTEFKLKYWGHSDTVLHEHDIRKGMSGDWSILNNPDVRYRFITDLSNFMIGVHFDLIATVIKKDDLYKHATPCSPYELALLFCMERLHNWLLRKDQTGRQIQLQVEARGKTEDKALELEFRRICDNTPSCNSTAVDFMSIGYHIRFLDKKSNSTGLQIADLIARPIGLHCLRPMQQNHAFDIIKTKFIDYKSEITECGGLKIFP